MKKPVRVYIMKLRLLLFLMHFPLSSLFAQDWTSASLNRFGVGLSISSLSRATLVQSRHHSIGGTGFEIGARLRFWRLGMAMGGGLTFMQTPDRLNLKYNRVHVLGGELEWRFCPQQQWIVLFGVHRQSYNYLSKVTEIAPGIEVESLKNEIVQNARYIGAGYQIHPKMRISIYYQWERVDENLSDILPSSAYLLARLSLILDSNQWKATKEAKE